MRELTKLMKERQVIKQQLREVECQIKNEVFSLPKEVIKAVDAGIVKFNFPLSMHIREELSHKYKD